MRLPTLASLLTWSIWNFSSGAASAQQSPQQQTSYNSVPSSIYTNKRINPFDDHGTYELDLIFPLGSQPKQLTFLPSVTFPAIFALQNTDFIFSFRPKLEVRITKSDVQYEPYNQNFSSFEAPKNATEWRSKNRAKSFVTELSNWYFDPTEPVPEARHEGIRYLTYNLSSLIDLTVPGEYTLSWSFYAHNCSDREKWGTSPYDNSWVMDYYFPQAFETGLDTEKVADRIIRYYGTRHVNFTIASPTAPTGSGSEAARNPMATTSWLYKDVCPWDNVILHIAGEKRMFSQDPMHNPYPGEGYTNEWMPDNVTITEDYWEKFNRWCTYLAPPELGVSSVEEAKTRKVNEELRYGHPCNALLNQNLAEKVMREFLGEMSLEEAVRGAIVEEEESAAWRVGLVGNGLGFVAVVAAMGALLI